MKNLLKSLFAIVFLAIGATQAKAQMQNKFGSVC